MTYNRKFALGFMALAALALCLSPLPAQAKTFFSIGTAKIGGTWYPIGAGIAEVLNQNLKDIQVSVEETAGAEENVRRIVAGDMEIGLTVARASILAYKGEGIFKGKPKSVLGWFCIENRYQTSISLASSDIKTAADLKGKRVGIGVQGSANYFDGKIWLWGHGIDLKDVKPFYMGQAEQVAALKDGRIDALLWTTGVPSASIQELCISRKVRFIPTTQEAAQKISATYPYYKLVTLPAGAYRGMDKPYQTLLNNSLTVVKPGLSNEMVYNMTKAIFSNLPKLGSIHNVFKELNLQDAIATMPIPVHPGALRYYKEHNVPGVDKWLKAAKQ